MNSGSGRRMGGKITSMGRYSFWLSGGGNYVEVLQGCSRPSWDAPSWWFGLVGGVRWFPVGPQKPGPLQLKIQTTPNWARFQFPRSKFVNHMFFCWPKNSLTLKHSTNEEDLKKVKEPNGWEPPGKGAALLSPKRGRFCLRLPLCCLVVLKGNTKGKPKIRETTRETTGETTKKSGGWPGCVPRSKPGRDPSGSIPGRSAPQLRASCAGAPAPFQRGSGDPGT